MEVEIDEGLVRYTLLKSTLPETNSSPKGKQSSNHNFFRGEQVVLRRGILVITGILGTGNRHTHHIHIHIHQIYSYHISCPQVSRDYHQETIVDLFRSVFLAIGPGT